MDDLLEVRVASVRGNAVANWDRTVLGQGYIRVVLNDVTAHFDYRLRQCASV